MNNIKGFTFYKSYYESLKDLKEKDKKDLLNAMLDYVFEDKIPKFSGIKKIVWTLIQPNLNSSKNHSNTNAGAPLGNQNASKEKQSKNNQKTISDLKDKDKDKDKDKEREENILFPTTPTEIFDYCFAIFKNYLESDMKKSCEKMFNHYEANNWKNIYNWKKKAEEWIQDDIDSGKIKENKKEYDTRMIYTDRETGKDFQYDKEGNKHFL